VSWAGPGDTASLLVLDRSGRAASIHTLDLTGVLRRLPLNRGGRVDGPLAVDPPDAVARVFDLTFVNLGTGIYVPRPSGAASVWRLVGPSITRVGGFGLSGGFSDLAFSRDGALLAVDEGFTDSVGVAVFSISPLPHPAWAQEPRWVADLQLVGASAEGTAGAVLTAGSTLTIRFDIENRGMGPQPERTVVVEVTAPRYDHVTLNQTRIIVPPIAPGERATVEALLTGGPQLAGGQFPLLFRLRSNGDAAFTSAAASTSGPLTVRTVATP
jgi:hypothetical protein